MNYLHKKAFITAFIKVSLRFDFNLIKTQIREELGQYLYQETECKPMIIAVVQEV